MFGCAHYFASNIAKWLICSLSCFEYCTLPTINIQTNTLLLFCLGESVFARCLSSLKGERAEASKVLPGPGGAFSGDKKAFVEDIRQVSSVSTHTYQ